MEPFAAIHCRYGNGTDLIKNGHSENGTQRYRCQGCGRSFQVAYRYNAWKPGTKAQIEEQTLNSSGVREISRNLKISANTVLGHLKKSVRKTPTRT